MNKDVIYVDVDDDVTAIIGKIKTAKEKIVALVPPKRAGVLQSAVNLRLLDRMARTEKKQLVLITGNQALVALAASAKIPVAKNLQTKPEVAEIAALKVDDGDDIIDGSELPVGDHAKTTKIPVSEKAKTHRIDDSIDVSELDIEGEDVTAKRVTPKSKQAGARKSPKIPNFDTFRKKIIWIGAGGVALIALLVWMFVFAPAATIVITASTSSEPVNTSVRLGGSQPTSVSGGVISSIIQQEESTETVDFEATGQKDVGERATGTMTVLNCENTAGITLSAGTSFTASNGRVFYSTSAVSVPGFTGSSSSCRASQANAGRATVNVQASASGESFNIGTSRYTVGVAGDIYANGSAMTGGTTKVVKVVTADDVAQAREKLADEPGDATKSTLKKKFTDDQVVIDESFSVKRGDAVSAPEVGKESSDGKAKLTVKTVASMQAVAKKDLNDFLQLYLDGKLSDKENQKVYSTGADKASFTSFKQEGDTSTVTLVASGRVGPKIDEAQVKENAGGKRYGDIQQSLQSIDGVKDVDVRFSYFWVTTVPKNSDKIKIEFKVDENGR